MAAKWRYSPFGWVVGFKAMSALLALGVTIADLVTLPLLSGVLLFVHLLTVRERNRTRRFPGTPITAPPPAVQERE